MSLLRDIDEKYVPRLAEALDRLARRFPKGPEPAGPLPVILRLRRLDDRWTAAGPLALLREIPQLGAVLIGVLVLVSGATARARIEERRAAEQRAEQGPQGPSGPVDPGEAPAEGVLGPQVGHTVEGYLEEARKKLQTYAPRHQDEVALAVISFRDYKTPEEARDVLGLMQVRTVFYRAAGLKPNQAVAHSADVTDVVADTKAAFRTLADELEGKAKENRSFADSIGPDGDLEQKREHERDAELWEFEARILRGPCECVFAVVVQARIRQFLDATRITSVRVVDISEAGADPAAFAFTGLLPEDRKGPITGGNQE